MGASTISRDLLDHITDELATAEACHQSHGDAVCLLPNPAGFYHVDVLLKALEMQAGLTHSYVKIDFKDDATAAAFLVGSGSHWQAVVRSSGRWQLCDEWTLQPIRNLVHLVRTRITHGHVVLLLFKSSATTTMQTDAAVPVPDASASTSQSNVRPVR